MTLISHPLVRSPPSPPTGGAVTRRCPSLIIPQTKKKKEKEKKDHSGLAKCANEQRKERRLQATCRAWIPRPHTYRSTPIFNKTMGGARGAQRAQKSPRKVTMPFAGRGTPAPSVSRRDRGATSSGEAPVRASGSTPEPFCTEKTATKTEREREREGDRAAAKKSILFPYQLLHCFNF